MGLFKRKKYSGYTEKTAENLLLDAGAFFVDFDVETDTFETAVTEGKLLGATRGGGQFSAIPEIRRIEVDGVAGPAKGLTVVDSWGVKMAANIIEVSKEAIKRAITASNVDTATNEDYDIIRAKNYIDLEDYINNITFVGTLSGSKEPVIIQVFNALNVNGLTLQTQSKNEAVIAFDLEGHYDTSELDSPPFAIYYPKSKAVYISPKTVVFDLNSDGAHNRDIELSISGESVNVQSISIDEIQLEADTHYNVTGAGIKILKSKLADLSIGSYVVKIVTDLGDLKAALKVIVTN